MSDNTPEAIARWMLNQLEQREELYQAEAADEIAGRFGSEFIYTNDTGRAAP